ncbi:alpha-E domain-containing protein [Echinicola strongylocentroti]|uniref:Alpha-E domain-containing protein n=1 Tax=Echinicola strongylocentroti TaxID=1795355 RepID=A0A2Z4IEU7_9BACT|nr:alpha-E domain-containing protein [Echinicola strongylocentroti]AWW29289.1 alpha-E domain-containing protein [Echinicola strongylocentroti]
MLSRVANSIYWLGRYLERAENYARFIDVNFNLMLDLPPGLKAQWEPLVLATGDHAHYVKSHKDFDKRSVIFFMTLDRSNPNSILSAITYARENGRIVREHLSKETWEKINGLYHMLNNTSERKIWGKKDPRSFFEDIKYQIQLLYGLADTTVARTEGWYFRTLGMYLERADKTSRILDVKYHMLLPSPQEVGSPLDFLHWNALLKSVSAFNTYRRLYGTIESSGLLEFLVFNRRFPRSIYFCIKEAEDCLHMISDSQNYDFKNSAEKEIGALRSKLAFSDIADIIKDGLHESIDEIQQKINVISSEIELSFFQIKQPSFTQNQSQS